MPVWYWEKKDLIKNSPSAKDGIDWDAESKLRVEGVRLIFDVGSRMKLPYETWATGAVYFHRFYVFRSFKQYDRRVMATACLFLAGKVEETPKKGKDLLKVVKEVLQETKPDEDFSLFGEDPKETLIVMERIVLKTIQFDLQVEHPYSLLLKLLKEFRGDKDYKAPVAQMAWTFVNDSFCTTLCLQWEADIIAAAMLYLATKMKKDFVIDLANPPIGFDGKWWKIFVPDLGQAVIEDVCHQQLDFISGNFGGSTTKKKKKKSSSSASSTPGPGPGPSAPVVQNDKRKATGPPTTPYELASKKMKQEETTPALPSSSFPQTSNFSFPPPPPAAPPPPPPPPPPGSNVNVVSSISSIPVHTASQRSSRPRSNVHSPADRDFHHSHSTFEGQPIPALGSGSNGSSGNNTNLNNNGGNLAQQNLPQIYPPGFTESDSRSPSPTSGTHPPLRRSSSYQRRDNGRDHRLPAQPQHRANSRDRDHSSKTSTASFQSNNNRLSNNGSRFDSNKSGGTATTIANNGSSGGSGVNRSADRRLPQQPPSQPIKPLLSPPGEPPPGFRNPGTANGELSVSNSGTTGMFHSTYAAVAAFGSVQPRAPVPSQTSTPFDNLVANLQTVSNLPRTPLQMPQQFHGMPPISLSLPPPGMIQRPLFSSPSFPGQQGAVVPPNGLSRTPSNRPSNNFSSIPSLLPPR